MQSNFRQPVKRFRAGVAKSEQAKVDRTGGKWGAGIIRGVSLNTRGEALGHDLWGDAEFVRQVADAAAVAPRGLKARFTHPSMSADGLARYMGRIFDAHLSDDGTQAIGDVHFTTSAHNTPDGDLADYVMTRAEEDPSSFGMSIVFERDVDAEEAFMAANGAEFGRNDEGVRFQKGYRSPDADNVNNYRHARLAKLWGCDAVDEPAANPDGLFHSPLVKSIEAMAGYALGLTQDRPVATALDVNADRLRDFAARFLQSHGLKIVADPLLTSPGVPREEHAVGSETQPTTDQPATDGDGAPCPAAPSEPSPESVSAGNAGDSPSAETEQPTAQDSLSQLRRYLETFGDVGARYLADGLSFEAAVTKDRARLADMLRERTDQLQAAHAQLSDAGRARAAFDTSHLEESAPLRTSQDRGKVRSFTDLFRIRK